MHFHFIYSDISEDILWDYTDKKDTVKMIHFSYSTCQLCMIFLGRPIIYVDFDIQYLCIFRSLFSIVLLLFFYSLTEIFNDNNAKILRLSKLLQFIYLYVSPCFLM